MTELEVNTRPLPIIEAELDLLERDTMQKETALIENYIEVGRRLEEVKAQLDHGQWGPWLEKRGYPQPKAIKLMKVFRAYGTDQQSLFGGEAKSKAFSNLGFNKLVQLLAIEDEGEREAFVEENDVENMSTRELEKALRERDEARRQAEESDANAKVAKEARAKMEADMRILQASVKEKDKAARDLVMTQNALKGERKESANLRRDLKQAREELKALKDKPVEVAVETREPTAEELERLTSAAVEQARAEDRERIAAMEKQLAAADGDVASFRVHYEAWQENYNKMMGYLAKVSGREPERAGKLRMAVKAVVERMVEV